MAETNDDILARVIGWYDDSVDATMEARRLSERDRDYYDNKQLTDAEVKALNDRGQPPVVINRIKAKVDTLLGLEAQTRTDPKAFPRTPQDEQGAHAATDAIRFVCDKDRFPAKRSEVFKNIVVEGMGGLIVEVKGEKRDISIRRIPWDRIIYDPHSHERNFEDAVYKGIVAWSDIDEAVAMYGKKANDLYETSVGEMGDTHDDKPKYKVWADGKRKRIRLVEMYYKQSGKWRYCVFTKAGFLIEPQDSPYQDENGEPSCPIELQSCFVDRDNNRYGVVRQLIGPQDEINKRRSKALHLITTRQWLIEKGAVDSVTNFKKEAAKPDGVMVVNPGMKAELQDTNDMAQANLGMLQEAKAEIDAVGANAALQGKDSNSTSGRQDEIKQQNAITELAAVMDARTQLNQATYRQVWARVKQFWTAPMWIRITEDERNVKFVGLNQPLTAGEQMLEKAQQQKLPPEQLQQLQQQIEADPAMQQVVGTKNNTAQLDVDISLEDAPDTATLQTEQFGQLADLAKAYGPQFMPIDLLIEASSLRNKDKILERLQGGGEEQQPPSPMQQAEMATVAAKSEQEAHKAAKEKFSVEGQQLQNQKTQLEIIALQQQMGQPQVNEGEGRERAEQAKLDSEERRHREKVEFDRSTAIEVEQIRQAGAAAQAAQQPKQQEKPQREQGGGRKTDEALAQSIAALTAMMQNMNKPRRSVIERGPDGRAVGVKQVE